MSTAQTDRQTTVVRPRHRRRGLLLILGILLIWLAIGSLRAPAVARDYFAASENPKQVSEVRTSAFPVFPPFWIVQIEGTVTEATGVHYISARILGVEPITGFVIGLGAG
jgi:hypothetical protein